ncbi:Meiotic recombination protein dmc1 [Ceratobasidium sp. 423]|nr:Meiotic recombination protein dmc1 [Ceratobasidium sp. 423]
MPVPVHNESRTRTPPGDEMDFVTPNVCLSLRLSLECADEARDEPQWDMIDELQSHGINAQDITKLKVQRRHMHCVSSSHDLVPEPPQDQGMSEAKVEKIKEAAQKILGSSFQTGVQVSEKRKRVLQISSGSRSMECSGVGS